MHQRYYRLLVVRLDVILTGHWEVKDVARGSAVAREREAVVQDGFVVDELGARVAAV